MRRKYVLLGLVVLLAVMGLLFRIVYRAWDQLSPQIEKPVHSTIPDDAGLHRGMVQKASTSSGRPPIAVLSKPPRLVPADNPALNIEAAIADLQQMEGSDDKYFELVTRVRSEIARLETADDQFSYTTRLFNALKKER